MNSFDQYIREVTSLNNPIIYTVMFSLLIITLVLLFFFKVIVPLREKFFIEKQNLILEQTKLIALFAELDPDPSLRCNTEGLIIQTNDASRSLFKKNIEYGSDIRSILNELKKEPAEIIKENLELSFFENIEGKAFLVNIRGISSYNFANIYLNDITKLREYETQLEEYKEKLRTLAEKIESRSDQLREQISSELHDDIGQKLVLLKMKINQLGGETKEALFSDLDNVYTRIRQISHEIKPSDVDDLGLKFSLQSLVEKVNSDSNMEGYFSYLGEEEKFGSEIELYVYRTAQEAVTNILKHESSASRLLTAMAFWKW